MTKKSANSVSQYRGVFYQKFNTQHPWGALIHKSIDGRRYAYSTYHTTELEAAKGYDVLAIKYHGKKAILNFVNDVE
jgi:hypothetical protein